MKKLLLIAAVAVCAFAAPAETVTVGEGEDAVVYNLAELSEKDGVKGAKDYVDAYADNVQADKERFKEHEAAALATIRTENRFFGSWWAILPPLIAIFLALITKEVYSRFSSAS